MNFLATNYMDFSKNAPSWGFRKFMKRDLLLNEENCPGDLLTIVCEVSIRSEKVIKFKFR